MSLEGDQELLRTGPSATAVVTEVSSTNTPLPLFGDPYQAYDMRLLHGDQREFIVTGAVGEFRTGERVEVKVDPEGILTPKLARDTEPRRALDQRRNPGDLGRRRRRPPPHRSMAAVVDSRIEMAGASSTGAARIRAPGRRGQPGREAATSPATLLLRRLLRGRQERRPRQRVPGSILAHM